MRICRPVICTCSINVCKIDYLFTDSESYITSVLSAFMLMRQNFQQFFERHLRYYFRFKSILMYYRHGMGMFLCRGAMGTYDVYL